MKKLFLVSIMLSILFLAGCQSDTRILLTTQNISQYNSRKDPQCDEKFHTAPANATVRYSNSKKGIAFDVPYNLNWGSDKFRIAPYFEYEDLIQFGQMGIFDACIWSRPYTMHLREKKSAEEVVSYIQESDPPALIPVPPTTIELNGLTVVRYATSGMCTYPALQIIGEKHNYEFVLHCSADIEADLEYLENIVKSAELLG